MRNRGIGRGRMFFGALILFAAVIAWGTAIGMSPHGTSVANGTDHVRGTVVSLLTKAALITLFLTGLATWLLFPTRRPKSPRRDYAILAVVTLLIGSCIYELAWLQVAVLR